jgi:hypothetical protein
MAGLDPATQRASVSERMTLLIVPSLKRFLPRGRAALGGRLAGRPW